MSNGARDAKDTAMIDATNERVPAGSWGAAMASVFESSERALEGVDRLERAGFELSRLSVIGKDDPTPGRPLGIAVAGVHARLWGPRAALWNRLADAPAALAFAWVPFVGHIVAVGPAACVLVGAAARHANSSSALVRMLAPSGMSPGEVHTYEAAIRGGQIVLLVHGSTRDVARARHFLHGAKR